jgi:hypothetical protein
MKKLRLISIPIILSLIFGCSLFKAVTPSKDKTFYLALKEHVRLIKAYNDFYEKADPELQAVLKEKVTPTAQALDDAMQIWYFVHMGGGTTDEGEIERYLYLKNEVIKLLIEFKIIEVE